MPIAPHPEVPPVSGREVRRIRRKLGISQNELARVIGIRNGQLISHFEAGRRVCGGPIARLVRLLDVKGKSLLKWLE